MEVALHPSESSCCWFTCPSCDDDTILRLFWSTVKGAALGSIGSAILFAAGVQVLTLCALPPLGLALVFFVWEFLELVQEAPINARVALLDEMPNSLSVAAVVCQQIIQFRQAGDFHAFHHEVAILTDQIRDNNYLKSKMHAFFNALEGTEALLPDGTRVTLKFALHRERLEKQRTPFLVAQAQPGDEETLQKVYALGVECFGERCAHSLDYQREFALNRRLFVARNARGELLGFTYYRTEPENRQHRICCFARAAEAARLGVGEALMDALMYAMPNGPVVLEVRANNLPAQTLYRRFDFQFAGETPHYYSHPTENALTMRHL